jgi:hypothetical protein
VRLPSDFVTAGRFVAFATQTESDDSGGSVLFTRLFVVDLRDGRRVMVSEAIEDSIFDWVLKRNGSIAWLRDRFDPSGVRYEVHKRDSTGTALLEDGRDVEHGSLALAGSRVYWTRGGAPRTAELR